MSKKVLIKTLLTTSTVGILGGGIATSLALSGCSKSEKNLFIEVNSVSDGIVGKDSLVEGSLKAIGFKIKEGDVELPTGSEFKSLHVNYENKTFTVELSKEHVFKAEGYPLILKYNDVISNKVDIILTIPITITASTTSGVAYTAVTINGTYETHSYVAADHEFEFVGSDFEGNVNSDGTFTANITKPSGNYNLQIRDITDNLLSEIIVVHLDNPDSYFAMDGSNWSGRTSGLVSMTTSGYTATITSNSSFRANDLIIPQFVGDGTNIYQVIEVGANAFLNDTNLTGSLTIPNSVVAINSQAFKGCNLTGTLSIGAGVTNIVQGAFDGYRFADIIIDSKNTVYGLATNVGEAKVVVKKTNGDYVINYDTNNKEVISTLAIGRLTIPNGVTRLRANVFTDCRGLTGELVIPDSVTQIDGKEGSNGAFWKCSGFTSLHLGSGLVTIQENAFNSCGGISGNVIFPPNLRNVAMYSFGYTSFTSLTISSPSTNLNNITRSQNQLGPSGNINQIIFKGFNTLPNGSSYRYMNVTNGTLITSGGLISNADALTFGKSHGLGTGWRTTAQSLEITETSSTFDEDNNEIITGTYTTDGIEDPIIDLIGNDKDKFSNFSAIDGTFSATLVSSTIAGNYNLQLIARGVKSNKIPCVAYANATGTNWSGYSSGNVVMEFDDVNNAATIKGSGTLGVDNNYVANNLVIPKEVIHDSKIYQVIEIYEYAFAITDLTGSLTIPNGVTSIGNNAFNGCANLTGSLTIPGSVETIGIAAFKDCSGFTGSLTIESGVETIEEAAFNGCSSFTEILTIPNTVEDIGNSAFAGCNAISTIYLDHFDAQPSWSASNIFFNWADHGTVVSDGSLTSVAALEYLKTLGLPDTWIAEGQALEIEVATPTATVAGTELSIEGSYDAIDVSDENIALTSDAASIFTNFSASEGAFLAILPSATAPGTYILQLVANNIVSNPITFTVGYDDTGTDWSGRTSGSVAMTFDDESETATITGQEGYAATDLVIPEYVIHDGKSYAVTWIAEEAFKNNTNLVGSLTIGSNVTNVGASAFSGCTGFSGSLIIPNSIQTFWGHSFENCSGFTNITLVGYDADPTWNNGGYMFTGWNENTSSTVSTSGGTLTAASALTYLQGIGLSSNWKAATL